MKSSKSERRLAVVKNESLAVQNRLEAMTVLFLWSNPDRIDEAAPLDSHEFLIPILRDLFCAIRSYAKCGCPELSRDQVIDHIGPLKGQDLNYLDQFFEALATGSVEEFDVAGAVAKLTGRKPMKASAGLGLEGFDAFVSGDDSIDWLARGWLTRKQNAIIAGHMKCMKTSIALDAAVSLASGTPVLGVFEVPKPQRVGFISAESGRAVIKAKLQHTMKAKGLSGSLPISFGDCVPSLDDPEDIERVRHSIAGPKLDVLFIDPAYLSLGDSASSATSAPVIGGLLRRLGDVGASLGCSIVLVHHLRRGTRTDDKHAMPELDQISQAGFPEWARGWLLVARRENWRPGSPHRLWINAGHCAGEASQWAVDIDEGHDSHPDGRFWLVDARPADDVRRRSPDAAGVGAKILAAITANEPEAWRTQRKIAALTKTRYANLSDALRLLAETGAIESRPQRINGKDTVEFRALPVADTAQHGVAEND